MGIGQWLSHSVICTDISTGRTDTPTPNPGAPGLPSVPKLKPYQAVPPDHTPRHKGPTTLRVDQEYADAGKEFIVELDKGPRTIDMRPRILSPLAPESQTSNKGKKII